MFRIEGKYGSLHLNGMSIDIEKTNVNELEKYLKELEKKQIECIEQQNNYLSQIIEIGGM